MHEVCLWVTLLKTVCMPCRWSLCSMARGGEKTHDPMPITRRYIWLHFEHIWEGKNDRNGRDRPSGGGFGGDPSTRRPPKLVLVRFQNQHAQRVDDFVTGFQLEDGTRWARPVDVSFGPDGAIYFTSDFAVNGLFRLRQL